jgi:hypothetical protein
MDHYVMGPARSHDLMRRKRKKDASMAFNKGMRGISSLIFYVL